MSKCEACKIIERLKKGKLLRKYVRSKVLRKPPTALERGMALLLKDKCSCVKPVELEYIHNWGSYTEYVYPIGGPEQNFVAIYDANKENVVVEYYNKKGHLVEQSYVGYKK